MPWESLLASFASGVFGALLSGVAIVIALKTDMRWVKRQLEVLHDRISNVTSRLNETREELFRNLPKGP